MYIMKLNIGDWSNDGHGVCVQEVFKVNFKLQDVQQAYKQSCKTTGLQFNHNEDYTGGYCKGYGSWRQLFTEYDGSTITGQAYEQLANFMPEVSELLFKDDEHYYCEDFSSLWWGFVKISLPELTYEKVQIDNINGYWSNNLNVQFGYGVVG
jgi:hypothetical protein